MRRPINFILRFLRHFRNLIKDGFRQSGLKGPVGSYETRPVARHRHRRESQVSRAFIGMQEPRRTGRLQRFVVRRKRSTRREVLVAQTQHWPRQSSASGRPIFAGRSGPRTAVTPAYHNASYLRPNAIRELSRFDRALPDRLRASRLPNTKLISAGKGGVLAAILPAWHACDLDPHHRSDRGRQDDPAERSRRRHPHAAQA